MDEVNMCVNMYISQNYIHLKLEFGGLWGYGIVIG